MQIIVCFACLFIVADLAWRRGLYDDDDSSDIDDYYDDSVNSHPSSCNMSHFIENSVLLIDIQVYLVL